MKNQIKFQKILFLVTLVIAALSLVYGFAFCTGAIAYAVAAKSGAYSAPLDDNPINSDALYMFVMGKGEYDGEIWPKAGVGFNNLIVVLSVVLIVICALQFFFASNSRRNYYITNYISVGVLVVFAIVVAAVGLWGVSHSEALFNEIDFARYKEVYQEIQDAIANDEPVGIGWTKYSDSHAMFSLGYAMYAVMIIDAVMLVLNTVWKILLMRGEKRLLSQNSKLTEEVA